MKFLRASLFRHMVCVEVIVITVDEAEEMVWCLCGVCVVVVLWLCGLDILLVVVWFCDVGCV